MFGAFFLSALIPFVSLGAQEPEAKKVTEKRELFDGKTLDGWYTFNKNRGVNNDPESVFSVVDGMIRISGEEFGCITTCEAFRDYRIIIEYKWGEKQWAPRENATRDSGLLIHSVVKDGAFDGAWACSIESNIIQGGMGDFIVVGDGTDRFSLTAEVAPEKSPRDCYIWQKGGKQATIHGGRLDWFGRDPQWDDIKDFRGANDIEDPHGWTTMELVADGESIRVYINGTLVNEALHVSPSAGKIQVQSELAEIFIRRVTLLPLEK